MGFMLSKIILQKTESIYLKAKLCEIILVFREYMSNLLYLQHFGRLYLEKKMH